MHRLLVRLAVLLLVPLSVLATSARAQSADVAGQLRINLAWQVALEAAGFSPGILDAHFGRKSQIALTEYAARYFPGLSPYDKKVFDALQVDVEHATFAYIVTADDAAQVGPLPEDWNEKAKLDRLPYESLADCLTEKFHCTRGLLATLNSGVNLSTLNVGQALQVPNLRPFPGRVAIDTKAPFRDPRRPQADYLAVNLSEKIIRAFDKDGRQMAMFHCSVAKNKEKLPDRDAVIKTVAPDPDYTFDPQHWPEVNNVTRVLKIPPGPRNPVGLCWIGLDLPGYGIHGNPKPEMIGKTGSHGCFRLTNWDAIRLASMVREGLTVKVLAPPVAER